MQSVQIDATKPRLSEALGISDERWTIITTSCNKERDRILAENGGGLLNVALWLRACIAFCNTGEEVIFMSNYIGYAIASTTQPLGRVVAGIRFVS
ncbi:hypothetical protein HF324_18555 [Chitinophaga oryzae]|uniref:Uncharacterized protein n=1 Tax=Chitinophaga oryzae TaxID=2725414 RepID=A0ABX6LI12_9BACT|nr:hypothetical protein [Chitinophaga oryzae]QJB39751.1 hypothetical protein HF324_18555 [Chitinophaga oryzae]